MTKNNKERVLDIITPISNDITVFLDDATGFAARVFFNGVDVSVVSSAMTHNRPEAAIFADGKRISSSIPVESTEEATQFVKDFMASR